MTPLGAALYGPRRLSEQLTSFLFLVDDRPKSESAPSLRPHLLLPVPMIRIAWLKDSAPGHGNWNRAPKARLDVSKYPALFVRKYRQKYRELCIRLCRQLHRSFYLDLNLNLNLDLGLNLNLNLIPQPYRPLFPLLFAALFQSLPAALAFGVCLSAFDSQGPPLSPSRQSPGRPPGGRIVLSERPGHYI